jgi:hypothetical protein
LSRRLRGVDEARRESEYEKRRHTRNQGKFQFPGNVKLPFAALHQSSADTSVILSLEQLRNESRRSVTALQCVSEVNHPQANELDISVNSRPMLTSNQMHVTPRLEP